MRFRRDLRLKNFNGQRCTDAWMGVLYLIEEGNPRMHLAPGHHLLLQDAAGQLTLLAQGHSPRTQLSASPPGLCSRACQPEVKLSCFAGERKEATLLECKVLQQNEENVHFLLPISQLTE